MENIKLGTIIKVGNSLAITVPVEILRGLKIQRGDRVVLAVYDENTFAVRRVPASELRNLKPGELKF